MTDTLPAIRTQLITQALETRLKTLTSVAVYTAEIPDHPPAMVDDVEGRVGPYCVIWPHGPRGPHDLDLADQSPDVDYSVQIDCVAGYADDAQYLWDRVSALIFRWSPTIEGVSFGGFRPPLGAQTGPLRPVNVIKPPRFWVPLSYMISATA